MHVFKSPHDSAVKRTTCLLHREEMRTCRRPPTGFDSQPSSHLSGFCSKLTCTGSVLERTMREHISSGQRSLWRVWRRSSDELCAYMPETLESNPSSAGAWCSAAYLQPQHPGGTELRDQGQPELNCAHCTLSDEQQWVMIVFQEFSRPYRISPVHWHLQPFKVAEVLFC